MAKILVLIPVNPRLPGALLASAHRLRRALELEEATIGEHWFECHIETCDAVGDGRPFSAHAMARNAMLGRYLRPDHTHVLWIDADLTDYPRDLATRLHAIDPDGIVAPFVCIEGTDRFYDTRGFVDIGGRRAEPHAPYLVGGDLVPMQAVGCCYLAPARAYQDKRYEPTEGHTEHYSICAGFSGLVWAARRIVVAHANLPRYGEAWHTA